MPYLNYAVSVDKLDTNESVAMTDGTTGLVGELLAAKCSMLTLVLVVLHMIST